MYRNYFDFWDFIYFINKFSNTIRSIKLKERLKLLFFNNFLLKYFQDRINCCNLKIIRSTLQYLLLMITLINDTEIITLLYSFIFGFKDSKTNYIFKYNMEEQTSYMSDNLQEINNSGKKNLI